MFDTHCDEERDKEEHHTIVLSPMEHNKLQALTLLPDYLKSSREKTTIKELAGDGIKADKGPAKTHGLKWTVEVHLEPQSIQCETNTPMKDVICNSTAHTHDTTARMRSILNLASMQAPFTQDLKIHIYIYIPLLLHDDPYFGNVYACVLPGEAQLCMCSTMNQHAIGRLGLRN